MSSWARADERRMSLRVVRMAWALGGILQWSLERSSAVPPDPGFAHCRGKATYCKRNAAQCKGKATHRNGKSEAALVAVTGAFHLH